MELLKMYFLLEMGILNYQRVYLPTFGWFPLPYWEWGWSINMLGYHGRFPWLVDHRNFLGFTGFKSWETARQSRLCFGNETLEVRWNSENGKVSYCQLILVGMILWLVWWFYQNRDLYTTGMSDYRMRSVDFHPSFIPISPCCFCLEEPLFFDVINTSLSIAQKMMLLVALIP